MSDEGFHEIQLSGKQLVFLFMSAVVLAVVIFLLGVDVGRGVPAAISESAGATEGGGLDDSPSVETPTGVVEPELSYHEMLLGDAASAANTANTANTDSGAVPPPISEPAAAPPSSPVPPAPAEGWILQMGAYSTRAVADAQVAKLKELKAPAFVLAGSPDKLFRVRVGPYTDRAEAEQAKARLERQGFKSQFTR